MLSSDLTDKHYSQRALSWYGGDTKQEARMKERIPGPSHVDRYTLFSVCTRIAVDFQLGFPDLVRE